FISTSTNTESNNKEELVEVIKKKELKVQEKELYSPKGLFTLQK
ncbi:29787_t:CDS:1, partial [Gigaspora margarita]